MAEQPIKLRKRYAEGYSYKNQKSKTSNSGGSKKNQVKGRRQEPNIVGGKVLLVNYGEPQFCAGTGAPLPKRGMVVDHNGKLYRDFAAARADA